MQSVDKRPAFPPLPEHAQAVLVALVRSHAEVPHTAKSLYAVLESGHLKRPDIDAGIEILEARGFAIVDSHGKVFLPKQGPAIPLPPIAASYINPEYIKFVEALFKCFYKPMAGGQFPNGDTFTIAPELDFNATLMHAAIGIAGEGGELLDAAKKAWVYNKPLDAENMKEELGDLFFYIVKMLRLLNLTLDEVIAFNQAKLLRRYPNAVYSDQHAQQRLDKASKE